jgi:hypothetical protein
MALDRMAQLRAWAIAVEQDQWEVVDAALEMYFKSHKLTPGQARKFKALTAD